ncbi:Crp/Fnr family transcriptional regulator [Usitatibacter palustris]|uniref:Cyclic nucleotide-binding domain-containing protein n=1 Tax=Usitatibacter palustris TaxID=2732487 RepID=A0A6M4H3Q8_9PROT|nr:cyclic nucleotide-binding domain-containing protein [Usitatibacter palustris]QJR13912.1 hypothetical protein DSM104440_00702 [Usitatibacter palustris]
MDDMDFTKPAAEVPAASAPFKAANSRFYNAEAARRVFKASGREERFDDGKTLFVEDDAASRGGLLSMRAASRMYFVDEGQVSLTIGSRSLDIVNVGEIVGEMAVITGRPRSATATARGPCIVHSMDATELEAAIARDPPFALMLASVMYDRLRFIAARLASRPVAPGAKAREATVFEPELVTRLEAALPRSAVARYGRESIIMKEGQAGTFMYLVKSGRIAIAVGGHIVEMVGPGGTFGEMAVVDQSPRTARAGAVEESELIAIDRAALVEVVKKEPAFALALLRGIAERLRHMNAMLGK